MNLARARIAVASVVLAAAGIAGPGTAVATGPTHPGKRPGCQEGTLNLEILTKDINRSNAAHQNAKEDLPAAVKRNLSVAYFSYGNACELPKGNHFSVVLVKDAPKNTIAVHGAVVQQAVAMKRQWYTLYLVNRGSVTGLKGKAENQDWAITGNKKRRSDDVVAITGYVR